MDLKLNNMHNKELFFLLLSCVGIFVVVMLILINVIIRHKEKKFIKSIKAGDIFVYDTNVSLYYDRIKKYKDNPFDSTPLLVFPFNTCIIKELKESETGETWVCYNIIRTPKEISIAEKTDILANMYSPLNTFLEFRARVKRFEI